MRRFFRFGGFVLTLALLLGCLSPALASLPPTSPPLDGGLTILFTHDTHDHFLPDAADAGGYTRLAALLKEQRNDPTVLNKGGEPCPIITLDAGDFSMGSLFQTVYTSDAPELRALGAMGYDVTTLGNHEFDYRQQGLADMLSAARSKWQDDYPGAMKTPDGSTAYVLYSDPLPTIVQANYTTPARPDDPEAQALVKAMEDYPVTPYTVLERGGLKIAVFGLMGLDSHECAPMSGMVYEPIIDAAKRTVAQIKANESPDYIICLSHSGTEDGKGEDYELAKEVEGIDLIISGHTHTTLPEPIRVNDTLIVSCGPYTRNLGRITLYREGTNQGSLAFSEYKLIPIDSAVPADPDMTAMTEKFKTLVDKKYLSGYGLGYDDVLTRSGTDLTTAQTGDLIGEAYLSTVREIEGDSYIPIAFAVAPDGVIRDTIRAGDVTTANAFDILSLGSGSDGSPGYPLVSVYLTGKDLKNAFEVDASISDVMSAAELFGAGCSWTYNPHRMFLDRVTGCSLREEDTGRQVGIQNDRLYRVVADLYSGQMLGTVESKSFGLLTVTPRDENGEPVTDLESRIIHDGDGNEVKAWYALAAYLNGQAQVQPPHPGKTEAASWNPAKLLFPMGLPTLVVLLLGIVVIALVLLLVRKFTRPRRKRQNTKGYRPYRG